MGYTKIERRALKDIVQGERTFRDFFQKGWTIISRCAKCRLESDITVGMVRSMNALDWQAWDVRPLCPKRGCDGTTDLFAKHPHDHRFHQLARRLVREDDLLTAYRRGDTTALGSLIENMQRLEIYFENSTCERAPIILTPHEAVERFGAATTFEQAGGKVFCTACRKKHSHCRPSMTDYYFHIDLKQALKGEGPMPDRIPAWLLIEHKAGRWKTDATTEQLEAMIPEL